MQRAISQVSLGVRISSCIQQNSRFFFPSSVNCYMEQCVAARTALTYGRNVYIEIRKILIFRKQPPQRFVIP